MAANRPVKKKSYAVLVVSDDPAWSQFLVRSLSAVVDINCAAVDMEAYFQGGFDRSTVDAVVLDIGEGESLRDERLFAARQAIAASPLVVLSTELPHDLARRVVRLGSADWLQKPLDARQIVEAVLNLLEIRSTTGNKVYAVVSCVGGSGGTSTSILAAHVLGRGSKGAGGDTALVDLDFTKGSCATFLDLHGEMDIDGVVQDPERVDAEFLDLVRQDYRSLFSVFSFCRPATAYAPRGTEFVLRMMDVLTYQYRNTVVDLPAHYTPWRDRIFEAADGLVLTTEMTIPSIRQAQLVLGDVAARRGSTQNVVVMVNRYRHKLFSRGLGRKDAEKSFPGLPIFLVPDDWSVMQDAVDRGVAVADAQSGSAFVKSATAAIDHICAGRE